MNPKWMVAGVSKSCIARKAYGAAAYMVVSSVSYGSASGPRTHGVARWTARLGNPSNALGARAGRFGAGSGSGSIASGMNSGVCSRTGTAPRHEESYSYCTATAGGPGRTGAAGRTAVASIVADPSPWPAAAAPAAASPAATLARFSFFFLFLDLRSPVRFSRRSKPGPMLRWPGGADAGLPARRGLSAACCCLCCCCCRAVGGGAVLLLAGCGGGRRRAPVPAPAPLRPRPRLPRGHAIVTMTSLMEIAS